jgi:hypothetical protein
MLCATARDGNPGKGAVETAAVFFIDTQKV